MPAPTDIEIDAASRRLLEAAELGRPCAPVRDLIGASDVAAAYRVQQASVAARVAAGGVVVGRKVGLTSLSVQDQLGVHQPDFGVLFADMAVENCGSAEMSALLQPKVEAEVAFVLARDLADDHLDEVIVAGAVEHVVAALEIVDSRIQNWDITFADTVADNASSGLFVLGARRVALDEFDPVAAVMSMTINGSQASSGDGKACLGSPLKALTWLARTARDLGEPLRAGQVVLSGALGPMVAVCAGDRVAAEISGLGIVQVLFE